MSQTKSELLLKTANLLADLARTGSVSEEEAVRLAGEVRALADENAATIQEACERLLEASDLPEIDAEIQFENEHLLQHLRHALEDSFLSERETLLLFLHLQGLSNEQISGRLYEEVQVTAKDLNLLMSRVRYRLRKRIERRKRSMTTSTPDRWEAFQEIQRRLQLTPIQAAEWQDAIHEARH